MDNLETSMMAFRNKKVYEEVGVCNPNWMEDDNNDLHPKRDAV